ncbi:MAG TPA: hypothetical protein VFN78_02810 [Ktedonobacterales bacterium]|nr:hypothetical protein [Ktedonobacterales bacterium]
MPNRYEREIEEILSRMEESEPRRGFGDRIRPMQRPPSRARSLPSFRVPFADVLMLLSIILVLVASGLAYFEGSATVVTGIIGAIALVLFVVALVVGWRDRFRPKKKAQWRGPSYVEVTPIHRNPVSALLTRIRVIRLRMQYRRAQRENGEL